MCGECCAVRYVGTCSAAKAPVCLGCGWESKEEAEGWVDICFVWATRPSREGEKQNAEGGGIAHRSLCCRFLSVYSSFAPGGQRWHEQAKKAEKGGGQIEGRGGLRELCVSHVSEAFCFFCGVPLGDADDCCWMWCATRYWVLQTVTIQGRNERTRDDCVAAAARETSGHVLRARSEAAIFKPPLISTRRGRECQRDTAPYLPLNP